MMAGKQPYRWYLIPFAWLYGFAVSVRNRLFDFHIIRSTDFDIPVIVVGNISVGGTGKTPHVEYIISVLKDEFIVAVLSRGYLRKTNGFIVASPDSTVAEIGDEPRQIKSKFPDVTVAVDRKRVNGIHQLLKQNDPPDMVLLDDAFQHRYLKPGLSVLLIDYNRPLSKDHILPAGSLRESRYEQKRANIIIITKTPADIKPIDRRIMEKELNIFAYQTLYFTTLKYGLPLPVFPGDNPVSGFSFIDKKNSVLLITGIASPGLLYDYIKPYTSDIVHLAYGDHHRFGERDFRKVIRLYQQLKNEHKVIITTEKDAMRMQASRHAGIIKQLPVFYIPVEIDFLYNDKNDFDKQISGYVRKNNKHSSLHSK
jgi:tetraacyldisaccharide 4'-kinase